MSSPFNIVLIILCIVVAAGITIYAIFFNRRGIVKRKMKKTPLVKISSFIENDVARITGKIEIFGEPMLSPLSGRPCGYYHIQIEQKVQSGKSSNWRTVIDEEVAGNFIIRDGRYGAVISGKKLKTYLIQDKTFNSGTFNDADEQLNNYLAKKGHSSTGIFGLNKTMRYKEGILEAGEIVAVVGTGKWQQIDRGHPLYGLVSDSRILEISAIPEKGLVYLSDDPKLVALPDVKQSY